MVMNSLIWMLGIYSFITTVIIVIVAVFVINKGCNYAGRFKRNLKYADTVLTGHLDNLIKVHQAHKNETHLLINNVKELQKIVNEIIGSTGIKMDHPEYIQNIEDDTVRIKESEPPFIQREPETNIFDNIEYERFKDINLMEPKITKETTIDKAMENKINEIYAENQNQYVSLKQMIEEGKRHEY